MVTGKVRAEPFFGEPVRTHADATRADIGNNRSRSRKRFGAAPKTRNAMLPGSPQPVYNAHQMHYPLIVIDGPRGSFNRVQLRSLLFLLATFQNKGRRQTNYNSFSSFIIIVKLGRYASMQVHTSQIVYVYSQIRWMMSGSPGGYAEHPVDNTSQSQVVRWQVKNQGKLVLTAGAH